MTQLHVRLAQRDDSERIFELSNDPSVREASFSSKIITRKEHENWLEKTLNDTSILFLVGECMDGFVGQVRFSDTNTTCAILSISVTQSFRKTTYSSELFNQALQILRTRFPKIIKIRATTKPENLRSQNFLMKNGFKKQPTQSTRDEVVLELVLLA